MTGDDLTDFLLARVSEEEAVAQEVLRDRRRGIEQGARYEDPDTNPLMAWEDGPKPFAAMSAERVLADCKAKRRLVQLWAQSDDMYGGDAGAFMDDALRAFVQPYADREDFRQEWRDPGLTAYM